MPGPGCPAAAASAQPGSAAAAPGLYFATKRTGCVESVNTTARLPFMSMMALATLDACASSIGIGLGVKFLGGWVGGRVGGPRCSTCLRVEPGWAQHA